MWGRRVYKGLVWRFEGKKPLGKPRRRWEGSIKMDLSDVRIDGVNWIQLAQDRVQWWAFVRMVMNFEFRKESRIFFVKLSDYQLFK
jgi:hypothetical protein